MHVKLVAATSQLITRLIHGCQLSANGRTLHQSTIHVKLALLESTASMWTTMLANPFLDIADMGNQLRQKGEYQLVEPRDRQQSELRKSRPRTSEGPTSDQKAQ